MKTIKVRNKPGQITPLIRGVAVKGTDRVLTHEEPVEVYLNAFVQRRLAREEWEAVTETKPKRETRSAKADKES